MSNKKGKNNERRAPAIFLYGDDGKKRPASFVGEITSVVSKKEDGEITTDRKDERRGKSVNRKSRSRTRSPKPRRSDNKHRSSSRSRDRKKRNEERKDRSLKKRNDPRRESRSFHRENTRDRHHRQQGRREEERAPDATTSLLQRITNMERDLERNKQAAANMERTVDDMKRSEQATLDEMESMRRVQQAINIENEEAKEKTEQLRRFEILLRTNGVDPTLVQAGMYPCIFVSGDLIVSRYSLGMASFTALMGLFGCHTVYIVRKDEMTDVDSSIINQLMAHFERRKSERKVDKLTDVKQVRLTPENGQNALVCSCCNKAMAHLGITHKYVAQLRRELASSNRAGAISIQAEVIGEKGSKLESRSAIPFLYVCLEERDQKHIDKEQELADSPSLVDDFPCITFFVDPDRWASTPTVCIRGRHNQYLTHERQMLKNISAYQQLAHVADTKYNKQIAHVRNDRKTDAKAAKKAKAKDATVKVPEVVPAIAPLPTNANPHQPQENDGDEFPADMYENEDIPSLSVR